MPRESCELPHEQSAVHSYIAGFKLHASGREYGHFERLCTLGSLESRPQHDRVHHIGAIGLKEDSAETGDGEEDLFAEQKTKHSAWMCTGVVHVFSMFCKGCFFNRYRLRSCFRIKATS